MNRRQEIESFAHIIFSGNPAQRDFWLGKGSMPMVDLEAGYGGRKPCIHGSDAHDIMAPEPSGAGVRMPPSD